MVQPCFSSPTTMIDSDLSRDAALQAASRPPNDAGSSEHRPRHAPWPRPPPNRDHVATAAPRAQHDPPQIPRRPPEEPPEEERSAPVRTLHVFPCLRQRSPPSTGSRSPIVDHATEVQGQIVRKGRHGSLQGLHRPRIVHLHLRLQVAHAHFCHAAQECLSYSPTLPLSYSLTLPLSCSLTLSLSLLLSFSLSLVFFFFGAFGIAR